MESNAYKVPVKKWRKWSTQARFVFNELYGTMKTNQSLFLHPKAEAVSGQLWKTVCWNAAWIAADAVDGSTPDDQDRG